MSVEKLIRAIESRNTVSALELVRSGVDVNTRYGFMETPPIVLAAQFGIAPLVDALIQAGADPNLADCGRNTALMEAVRSGSESIVDLLLKAGVKIDRADDLRMTALHWAVHGRSDEKAGKDGEAEVVVAERLLSAGANANARDSDGYTPLMTAARCGAARFLTPLLRNGADPKIRNRDGEDAESIAALRGALHIVERLAAESSGDDDAPDAALIHALKSGDEERAAELLESGVDANSRDPQTDWPAIYWAALLGRSEVAKKLLASGANPDSGVESDTPLCAATRQGHVETARSLIDSGARVEPEKAAATSALFLAASRGETRLISALLDAGAAVDRVDKDAERTPLLEAAGEGHEEAVRVLLAAGADPNVRRGAVVELVAAANHTAPMRLCLSAGIDLERASRTHVKAAVFHAAYHGNGEILRLLLGAGADPDVRNEYKETPLIVAAEKGHLDAVSALISGEANVERKCDGYTALHCAVRGGHVDVVDALLSASATLSTRDPLLAAIVSRDEDAACARIEDGAKLDIEEKATGWTPLRLAILMGLDSVVEALLGAGVEVAPGGEVKHSPLVEAARLGRANAVQRLLDGGAITAGDAPAASDALVTAAREGHADVVRALLATGIDVAGRDSNDKTALVAASSQGHLEVVKCLVDAGADILETDRFGPAVLLAAARHDDVSQYLSELLREHDARAADAATSQIHLTKDTDEISTAGDDEEEGGVESSVLSGLGRIDELIEAILDEDSERVAALIDAGADVNGRTDEDHTPLLVATLANLAPFVERLLAAGADPNLETQHQPVLYTAAFAGHENIVKLLIEAGADLNADGYYGTAIAAACYKRDVPVAQKLIDAGCDVNVANEHQITPLMYAVRDIDLTQRMIAAGADVNARDDRGTPAIGWAASSCSIDAQRALWAAAPLAADERSLVDAIIAGEAARVEDFLRGGESPRQKDPLLGWPLVLWAALAGHGEMIEALVEAGAKVDARVSTANAMALAIAAGRFDLAAQLVRLGFKPDCRIQDVPLLAHAARAGSEELVAALLERGAKVTGETVIAAVRQGHQNIVRLLSQHGASLDLKGALGEAPLAAAILANQGETFDALLKLGADPNKKCDRETPLHVSVNAGRIGFVRSLIEAGADVSVKNGDGDTPLHLAIRGGDAALIGALTEVDSNVAIKNSRGQTPLHEAARSADRETFSLLLQRGADLKAKDKEKLGALRLAAEEREPELVRVAGEFICTHAERSPAWLRAILADDKEALAAELERGEIRTRRDPGSSWTPFEWVAALGSEELLDLLLRRSAPTALAQAKALRTSSSNALVLAVHGGHLGCAQRLLSLTSDSDDDAPFAVAREAAETNGFLTLRRLIDEATGHTAAEEGGAESRKEESEEDAMVEQWMLDFGASIDVGIQMRIERVRQLRRLGTPRTLVLDGRFSRFWKVPSKHLDTDTKRARHLQPFLWRLDVVTTALTDLGYSSIGDIVSERTLDVVTRLYAHPSATAYAAFNVGAVGRTVDFVTRFEDGAFYTTTSLDQFNADPVQHLYGKPYPGVSIGTLHGKHAAWVGARVRQGSTPIPALGELGAAAGWIDEFLARQHGTF